MKIKNIYYKLFPSKNRLIRWIIQSHPKYPNITILDLGCGRESLIQSISYKYSLGVDFCEWHLEESSKKRIHTSYLRMDLRKIKIKELLEKNQGKKYDIILLTEVIEHMGKKEGEILLNQIEELGNWKIVSTPNGFLKQPFREREKRLIKDLKEEEKPLQFHKCGWRSKEFEERSYKVIGTDGLKFIRYLKCHKDYFNILSIPLNISGLMVRKKPNLAGSLLCIKYS